VSAAKFNQKGRTMEILDERKKALLKWLTESCHLHEVSLEKIPHDASFRRYFRVITPIRTYVVMDAPPRYENCQPFIAVAKALKKHGLEVPDVYYADLKLGFLLLTDLGDQSYLKALNANNANLLYSEALQALVKIQACPTVEGLIIPPFNGERMWQEFYCFKEWFLEKLLGLRLGAMQMNLEKCFKLLVESAANQPQVFMHRDYHANNLMVLPDNKVGVLDFQDAFIGPVTYDLVSLLRDCYISWPDKQAVTWALEYLSYLQARGDLLDVSQEEFLYWFDLMGLERHLKALFTFARKYVRDQSYKYLHYIPRTLHYLLTVSLRYPQFKDLHYYLEQTVLPAWDRVSTLCEL
jgi:N-acetylmuramate 1-kinase